MCSIPATRAATSPRLCAAPGPGIVFTVRTAGTKAPLTAGALVRNFSNHEQQTHRSAKLGRREPKIVSQVRLQPGAGLGYPNLTKLAGDFGY
jgi:hypothetical protein